MRRSSIDMQWMTGRVMWTVVCGVMCGLVASEAVAKPRPERVVERRIMRLETMERRMEAAAQMPPRPADVRRALRAGVPVQGFTPAPAPRNAFARPAPPTAAPLARAPRPSAPEPQPGPSVVRSGPRVVPQPSQVKPVPIPAEPSAEVSPVTAVDDGTRSVLVGGEPPAAPTEAIEPIELLPPPPAK